MGRYYHGDIDGKFWVAVQSSTDADFFGVEGEVTHVNYYFTKEHLDKVKKGIEDCENCLGEYKKHLDNFFKNRGISKKGDCNRNYRINYLKLFNKIFFRVKIYSKLSSTCSIHHI